MNQTKPSLYTCLSPSLLHLYDVSSSIVVIIDVLRATSTIATALHNGAREVIPVAGSCRMYPYRKRDRWYYCRRKRWKSSRRVESMAIHLLNTRLHLLQVKPWCLPPLMVPSCSTWHWIMEQNKSSQVPFRIFLLCVII